MQAYMQKNWMQALNADKMVPVMDAASISASKVFEVPAIIVMQQKQNTGIYAAKLNANIQCRQHLAPHQQVYILNF